MNNMDKKFYISLEAAKVLKEKGYNEETDCTIDYNGAIWFGEYKDECDFPCITKAEAMDWLEGKDFKFSIMFDDNNLYEFIVYFENEYISVHEHISGYRETMLEAQDAAIITALEKL